MKTLLKELERMEFDNSVICMEEGYLLVYNAVSYYYKSGTFSFLQYNYEFEDILDEVFATCIKREVFNKFKLTEAYLTGKVKYNGKKSYINLAVKRMLYDLTNFYRTKITLSADATTDDEDSNCNFYNTISDDSVNIANEVTARIDVMKVLDTLDGSKGNAEGFSPLLGFSKLNDKNVMLHVLNGYTVTEISNIYINPKTGKNVARTYISRVIKDCAKYFK